VEVYRVLDGEFTFYFGAGDAIERVVAPAGAVVHVAGGREHTIRNESDRTARGFVTFTDGAAQMEGFVRAAAALAERGAPALEDVLAVAARHGVEITRRLPH
jgi:mannose-6-phosphate isomerase-like protein (cupin superfamily)